MSAPVGHNTAEGGNVTRFSARTKSTARASEAIDALEAGVGAPGQLLLDDLAGRDHPRIRVDGVHLLAALDQHES